MTRIPATRLYTGKRGPRKAPPSREALPAIVCHWRDLGVSYATIARELGLPVRVCAAAVRRAR